MQELLKLSQLDVYELASSNEDATRFLAELAVLHKREVCNWSPSTEMCA